MTLSFFFDTTIALLTLTLLEIVLGIDNLVFIAILITQLPKKKRAVAKSLGLFLALIIRLLFLASIVIITKLSKPLFYLDGFGVSVRDLFFLSGGIFLLLKGTLEIHNEFAAASQPKPKKYSSSLSIIIQIALLDIVFSFDSILTAVGLTDHFWIMATAIFIAILLMLIASGPLSGFIARHPTIKMLALSFLLLIGVVLIADGMHYHIPRAYIYFAICFSILVESLNTWLHSKKNSQ